MKILVLEPSEALASQIETILSKAGHIAEICSDGEDGIFTAELEGYQAIIIGPELPDMTSVKAAQRIRASEINTPIIGLINKYDPQEEVNMIKAGANNTMRMPVNSGLLTATIDMLVRQSHGHAQSIAEIGPIAIDFDLKSMTVNGEHVHLTKKQFGIIELLALRKNKLVTKEAILDHLYGGMDEPEMKIIDVFICKLRKKIADKNHGESCIETLWGAGYKLLETESLKNAPKLKSQADQTFDPAKRAEEKQRYEDEIEALKSQLSAAKEAMAEAQRNSTDEYTTVDGIIQRRRVEEQGVVIDANIEDGDYEELASEKDTHAGEFINGLRKPRGHEFTIGSFILIDTIDMTATNTFTQQKITLTPVVSSIFEILEYAKGNLIEKDGFKNYLFEDPKHANDAKVSMFISQAQAVLRELVGHDLAANIIQVYAGNSYGMPDITNILESQNTQQHLLTTFAPRPAADADDAAFEL